MNNQTANETKEFQQAEPAAQKVMTSTNEMRMRTVTISETTRNFLIILGKLSDIYDNIADAIEPICGECQLDETVDPAFKQLGNVREEVTKLLDWSIYENMSMVDSSEI